MVVGDEKLLVTDGRDGVRGAKMLGILDDPLESCGRTLEIHVVDFDSGVRWCMIDNEETLAFGMVFYPERMEWFGLRGGKDELLGCGIRFCISVQVDTDICMRSRVYKLTPRRPVSGRCAEWLSEFIHDGVPVVPPRVAAEQSETLEFIEVDVLAVPYQILEFNVESAQSIEPLEPGGSIAIEGDK